MKTKIAHSDRRFDRHKNELRPAQRAAWCGRREGRQHEGERRHDDQRGKTCARPLNAERLLVMRETADEQADPDDAGADDHDRGINRVAWQNGRVVAASEHHRENERGFDDGHRHGEDQRPEGLSDAVRHDFSVVDRDDDRTKQADSAQHGNQRADANRDRGDQESARQCRSKPGPRGHEPILVDRVPSFPAIGTPAIGRSIRRSERN